MGSAAGDFAACIGDEPELLTISGMAHSGDNRIHIPIGVSLVFSIGDVRMPGGLAYGTDGHTDEMGNAATNVD